MISAFPNFNITLFGGDGSGHGGGLHLIIIDLKERACLYIYINFFHDLLLKF